MHGLALPTVVLASALGNKRAAWPSKQPQQFTGLSGRQRSTIEENLRAFRAVKWTADGENDPPVHVGCVHVDFTAGFL